MGYKYYHLLSLDDIGTFDHDIMEKEWEAKFVKIYDELKNTTPLPSFGVEHSTSSGGCGTGNNDVYVEAFKIFTSHFPQFTFGLWLFYFDNTCIKMYKIKNGDILENNDFNAETITVGSSKIHIEMAMVSTNISNNITGLLNPQYFEQTGYEVTY